MRASRKTVEHINAHATSTPGDVVETRAIKTLFGEGAKDIAISATKSLVGHSIGASAAIGSGIATIMALHTGIVHPTINLDEADPECDLDYTPNQAQQKTRALLM